MDGHSKVHQIQSKRPLQWPPEDGPCLVPFRHLFVFLHHPHSEAPPLVQLKQSW